MGADAVQPDVLGYESLRQAGIPRPFEQRAVGAKQIKGSKIAWISPRPIAHALQQSAGIEFMLGADQYHLPKPTDKVCVLYTRKQLQNHAGIAHRPCLYALGQPRAACRLASPVTPLGAVFAVNIFRFVLVHTINLQ